MSFIEKLKRVVTRQQLMEALGIENESLERKLEWERCHLYSRATDEELRELAQCEAPLIGEDIESFFKTLKRVRELAGDTEKWNAHYKKWKGQRKSV